MGIKNIFFIKIYMSRQHDQHITIFSPEGRLYQVEYAFLSAKNINHTGIGYIGSNISCLIASKKISDCLINPSTISNIHKITNQIALMSLGRSSDCRSSCSKAREIAHEFYYKNGYEIPISYLSTQLADHFQMYTQHAYRRCFGCEVIICACDDEFGPQLFHVVPAGHVYGYKAVSIGNKKEKVNNYLDKMFKNYKEPKTSGLTIEEAIVCLEEGTNNQFKSTELEIVCAFKDKSIKRLTVEEIDKHLNV